MSTPRDANRSNDNLVFSHLNPDGARRKTTEASKLGLTHTKQQLTCDLEDEKVVRI